ncbi:MAG: HYR domain-containing protein, partial [Betaproteobacteria bacterium]|nr:HYR domain-containing protein [Betaproteobacteria bacterium]
ANDLLSDVSQGRIVFTRVFPGVRTAIMLFDPDSGTLSELAPAPASWRIGTAIGGQTVAFVDYGLVGDGSGEIMVLDLTTSALTRLTSDTVYDANPKVSPDGNVVTWERCVTSANCDVYGATRSGNIWTVQPVSASPLNERSADNNGTQTAFERDNLGGPTGSNIVLAPVSGGAETVLEIPGEQYNPSIRGQIVVFESRVGVGNPDIYVADLATNRYFQVTNTPHRAETLNDVTVLPTGEIRIVWQGVEETDPFNGNIYAATFTLPPVVVADTTPPVLVVPASIAVDATSPSGAVVNYVATATDAVDPTPVVNCAPPSGSTFPVGTIAVTCNATDASGNSATASFRVTVFGATEQIADLIDLVYSFNLRRGIENSLDAKLRNLLSAAGAGNVTTACNLLGAFINEVQAQSGKAITTVQANQLISAANQARAALGCG